MRVLNIEKGGDATQSTEALLSAEGFSVVSTISGEAGVGCAMTDDFDVILLDVESQDISGFEIIQRLRDNDVRTPAIFVGRCADASDKTRGLRLGADDFITKPFDKDELVARIHAVVRRSRGHAQSIIRVGELVINLDTKMVWVGAVPVKLTGKLYMLLEFLALQKGRTLSREALRNHIYDGLDDPRMRSIDKLTYALREKLRDASGGKEFIGSLNRRGYFLYDITNAVRTQNPHQ